MNITKKIKKYMLNLVNRVIIDDFFGMAAEMGFWFALGIFPFMLLVMVFFGWLGKKSLMLPIINFLDAVAPSQSVNLIKNVLDEVVIFEKGGLVAVFGIIVTIALASNSIFVIIKGLNSALGIEENRNLFVTRSLSVLMVFINAFILFISVNLIIFGKIILQFLLNFVHMSDNFINVIMVARWPVSFAAMYVMALLNYYILPASNEQIKRKAAMPGALFFCFCWMFGSWCFSVYINNLNTYNRVYGTIGAFAMLMVWLYYTSLIILIGGEVNSQAGKITEQGASLTNQGL
jgi:membrane protein